MAAAAAPTDKNKKKKKSLFAGLFPKKSKKKDIQIVPIQYVDHARTTTTNISNNNNNNNSLSTNQLAVRYDVTDTPPDVIQSSNNMSAPKKRQAPPPPTNVQGQGAWPTGSLQDASYRNHVSQSNMTSQGGSTTVSNMTSLGGITTVTSQGGSTTVRLISRSSSRSSGFDEISSSLTETSDVTAANKLQAHRQTSHTQGCDTLSNSSQATDTLQHNVDTHVDTRVDTHVDIDDGDDKSVIDNSDLIGCNKLRDCDVDSLDTLLDGDNYGHNVTSHSGDVQRDTEIVLQTPSDVTDDTRQSQAVNSENMQETIQTNTENSSIPQSTVTLPDVACETADDVMTAAKESEPLIESHVTAADQSQSSTQVDPNQSKLIEEFSQRFNKLAEKVKTGPQTSSLRTAQLHTRLSLRSLNDGSIDSQSGDLRPSTPCDIADQPRSGQQTTTSKIALNSAFRNMLTVSPRSRGVVTSPCRPHAVATLRRSSSTALSGISEMSNSVTIATAAAALSHRDRPQVDTAGVSGEVGNDETSVSENQNTTTSGHVTASPTYKSMTSSLSSLSPTYSDDVTHSLRPDRSRDQWIAQWSVVSAGIKGKPVDLFELGLHSSATDLTTSRLSVSDPLDTKFSLNTKKTAKSAVRCLQVRQDGSRSDEAAVSGKGSGWNSVTITSQKGVEVQQRPSGHNSDDEWPCPPSFASSTYLPGPQGLPGPPGVMVSAATARDPTDSNTTNRLTAGSLTVGDPNDDLTDCVPTATVPVTCSSPDWNIPATLSQPYNHNTSLVDDTESSIAMVESTAGSPAWRSRDWKTPVMSPQPDNCMHSCGRPDFTVTSPTSTIESTSLDLGLDLESHIKCRDSQLSRGVSHDQLNNIKNDNKNNKVMFRSAEQLSVDIATVDCDHMTSQPEHKFQQTDKLTKLRDKRAFSSTDQLYHQRATVFTSSDQLYQPQTRLSTGLAVPSSSHQAQDQPRHQLLQLSCSSTEQLHQPESQSHHYQPLHQPLHVSHSTPTTAHCSKPTTLFHSHSTSSSCSEVVTPDVFTDDRPLTRQSLTSGRQPLTGAMSTTASTTSGRLPSTTLNSAVRLRQRPCSTSDMRLHVSRHRSLLDSRSDVFDSLNRWQQRQQAASHQSPGGATLRKPVVTSRSQPVRALPLDSLTNKQLDVINEAKSPDKTTTTQDNKHQQYDVDNVRQRHHHHQQQQQQQQHDTVMPVQPGSVHPAVTVHTASVYPVNVYPPGSVQPASAPPASVHPVNSPADDHSVLSVPLTAPTCSVVPDVVSCSSVFPVFQSPVRRNSMTGRLESTSRDPAAAALRSRDLVSPPKSRDNISPEQRGTTQFLPAARPMVRVTSQSRYRPQSLILYPEQYVSRDQDDSRSRDRSQSVDSNIAESRDQSVNLFATHDVTEHHEETLTTSVRHTLQLRTESRDQTPAVLPWRRTLLVRSESMPIGGRRSRGTEAGKEVEGVGDELIPRTAMARFNDDGSPRSILKHSNTVQHPA